MGLNKVVGLDPKEFTTRANSALPCGVPYSQTIGKLPKIQEIENPILKLEYLYELFTEDLVFELKQFWRDVEGVRKSEMYIDADLLKGLAIYLLIQSK